METSRSSARRLVPISEDIFVKLVRVSTRVGANPRDLLESILSRVLDVLEYDPELATVIETLDAYRDLLRVSGLLLPRTATYRVLASLGERELEELILELKNSSKWFARMRLVKKGADPRDLKLLFLLWFPDATVDIIPTEGGGVKVVVIPAVVHQNVLRIVREISEEFLKALGFKVESISVSEGVVSVLVKTGESVEVE